MTLIKGQAFLLNFDREKDTFKVAAVVRTEDEGYIIGAVLGDLPASVGSQLIGDAVQSGVTVTHLFDSEKRAVHAICWGEIDIDTIYNPLVDAIAASAVSVLLRCLRDADEQNPVKIDDDEEAIPF